MEGAAVSGSATGSGRALDRLARERGLARAETGAIAVFSSMLGGIARPPRHLVGGRLTAEMRGVLADVVTEVERQDSNSTRPPVEHHAILLVTRVPEAAAFLPTLACHDAERHDLTSLLLGPGGLFRLYREVELESIAFAKRYRVGIGPGCDENRMRQLFSPTFVDWLAQQAPEGFVFEYGRGVLSVATTSPPADIAGVDRFCGFAAQVAERLRREALESPAGSGFETPAAAPLAPTPTRWKLVGWLIWAAVAGVLSGLASLVPLVALIALGASPLLTVAAVGGVFAVGFAWLLAKFRRSSRRMRDAASALDRVVRDYGRERGLTALDAVAFLDRHPGLPAPGAAAPVLSGTVAGVGEASLVVFAGPGAPGADGSAGYALAIVADAGGPVPSLSVTPMGERASTAMIGGFAVHGVQGYVPGRGDVAAGSPLRDRYDLLLDGDDAQVAAARRVVGSPALAAWLLDERRAGRCGVSLEGTTISVYRAADPAGALSAADLDAFCEEVPPAFDAIRSALGSARAPAGLQ